MIVTYKSVKFQPELVAKRYVRVHTGVLPPGDFVVYECLEATAKTANGRFIGAGMTVREWVCDRPELPEEIAAAAHAKRDGPWPNAVEWPL